MSTLSRRMSTSHSIDIGRDFTSSISQHRNSISMDSPLIEQLYTSTTTSNESDNYSTMSASKSPLHYIPTQYSPQLIHSPAVTNIQQHRPDYFHSHSADDIRSISQRPQTQLFPSHFSPSIARDSPSTYSETPFDRTPQLISDHSTWRQPSEQELRADFDDLSSNQISPKQFRPTQPSSNVSSTSSSSISNSPLLSLQHQSTSTESFLNRRASAPSLTRDGRSGRNNSSGPSRRRSVLSLRGQLPPNSFQLPSGSSSPYPTTGTPSFRTQLHQQQIEDQELYTPSSTSSSAGEMERLMSNAKLLDREYDNSGETTSTDGQSWTSRSSLKSAVGNYGFDYPINTTTTPNWNNSFPTSSSSTTSRPVFRQTVSSANVPLSYPPDWQSGSYSLRNNSNYLSTDPTTIIRQSSNRPQSAPHILSPQQENDYFRRLSADSINQNSLHPPRVSSSLARSNLSRQSCPTLITPPIDYENENSTFDQHTNLVLPRKQHVDYSSDEFTFGHQLDPNDPFATGPKRRLSSFSDPPPPEPILSTQKPLTKKALAAEKAQAKRDLKNGVGATRFVNYSKSDKNLLLSGVAPSGSSKRRRKEEADAEAEAEAEAEGEEGLEVEEEE